MARLDSYKGNSMIVLTPPNTRFPFQFGLTKAKMIVENIDAIRAFVETDGMDCAPNPERFLDEGHPTAHIDHTQP